MKSLLTVLIGLMLVFNSQTVFADSSKSMIEMLPWEQVNIVVPKYSKFIVFDLETGKQFRVQRRAGSNHADVQPLTSKDTAIMKKIYDGKWSWKRRAIIVIHEDRRIAASMHGMPHGAGALKNNFPGHFCIHFYGSTTHRKNFMDLSHKLMILKAAGKLDEYVGNANAYEIINTFVAGIKQQDEKIISSVSLQSMKWQKKIGKVENISLNRMPMLPAEDFEDELATVIPVEIEYILKNSGRRYFKGDIHLIRFSQMEPWKINSSRFLQDFSG